MRNATKKDTRFYKFLIIFYILLKIILYFIKDFTSVIDNHI